MDAKVNVDRVFYENGKIDKQSILQYRAFSFIAVVFVIRFQTKAVDEYFQFCNTNTHDVIR